MNSFMERLSSLASCSQHTEPLFLHPMSAENAEEVLKFSSDRSFCGDRRVEKIASCLMDVLPPCLQNNFSIRSRNAKTLALAIHSLLAINETGFCYYTKRKAVPLPYRLKIIIDKRYSLVHLLPSKNPHSPFDGGYKYGRPVCSLLIDADEVHARKFWSLSPKRHVIDSFQVFAGNREIEKLVGNVIPNGIAKCHFDYDYVSCDSSDIPKRFALYEYYDANDLFSVLVGFRPHEMSAFRCVMFKKIVEKIAKLHQHNIVWMDPKLENMLVKRGEKSDGSDWEIGFCDFDFSVNQNRERPKDIDLLGSITYMSPELMMTVLRDEWDNGSESEMHEEHFPYAEYLKDCPPVNLKTDDLRPSDVYSIGVSGMMLLTGNQARWGLLKENGEIFKAKMAYIHVQHAAGDPHNDQQKQIDRILAYIVQYMLCPDPRKRATIDEVLLFLQHEAEL